MEAGAHLITLFEDTFEYIDSASSEENAETFKEGLEEYIKLIQKVIDSDFDDISDKDYFELISTFYNIRLEEEDYLEMFSRWFHKKYSYATTIPTSMIYTSVRDETNKDYQVCYYAAISDDFEFDWNKTYTSSEIEELIDDDKIVIMREEGKEIHGSLDFEREDYWPYESWDITISSNGDNITQFAIEHLDILCDMLKEKYTRKKLVDDAAHLAIYLEGDIIQVLSNTESRLENYKKTAELCKEWYESSNAKKDFIELQRKIKDNKSSN